MAISPRAYTLASEQDTKTLAESLAKTAKTGDVFLLNGDLGVGKTTFSRFFVQSFLGEAQEVLSPTFTLVQSYETSRFTVFHFDLYRLENPEEVYDLGIEEAFSEGVSLIEWPGRLENLKPKVYVNLSFSLDERGRSVTIERIGV